MLYGCGAGESPRGEGDAHASDAAEERPWFEHVTEQSGIGFDHDSGHREGRYFIPEAVSGGAAVLDMNGNGYLDVYLIQAGDIVGEAEERRPNRLYRNRGDGTFEDITEGSGADDRGYGMGAAVGDYNNNGFPDIYITNVGRNTLLRNSGDETFTDVTESAGVGDEGFGASASFFDMNRNGNLDLFVVNYLNWSPETEMDCYNDLGTSDYCGPLNYQAPARDVLYRNNGDETFDDITVEAGLDAEFGNGLGIACSDFDLNGWIDVFVANDGNNDQLWVNQGDETFIDRAFAAGCAVDQDGIAKAGMGVAVADVNDSGLSDLIVCNLRGESDSFYINEGGYFIDSTSRARLRSVSRAFTRFGMAWHDFDNDGYLDLYQVNGRVYREATLYADDPYAEPNLLFRGLPDVRFEEVRPRGGTDEELIGTSRAAAFGDLTNSGGIDIIIVNRDGPAHVLFNRAADDGQWIMFRVIDENGRDAYNARLTMQVNFPAGTRAITREVLSGYSYLAANDPRVHVGLGAADGVGELTVRWIDGEKEIFGQFDAGQIITLRRGEGRSVEQD